MEEYSTRPHVAVIAEGHRDRGGEDGKKIKIETHKRRLSVVKATNNTVQDEPTWWISITRGFPTPEKTEFDRAKRAHHEYPIFVTI